VNFRPLDRSNKLVVTMGAGFAGLIAAGALGAGSAAAAATTWDLDGDGYAETMTTDADGDGSFEAVNFDLDRDGYYETLVADSDLDGVVDTVGFDTDRDGYTDLVFPLTSPSVGPHPSLGTVSAATDPGFLPSLMNTMTVFTSQPAWATGDYDGDGWPNDLDYHPVDPDYH